MGALYWGLLIGTAADLPPLFESECDGIEWMLEQAPNLASGLRLLARRQYDLVLAEYHRTDDAAADVVSAIRKAQPGIRLIVIDSSPSAAEIIEAMRQDAYSYFSRPFEVAAVRAMMRGAVTERNPEGAIRVLSALPEFLSLRMRCDLATADRLQHFFGELRGGMDVEERNAVATAFREVLLNSIEHGGKLNPDEWVRVSRVRTKRALVYHVEDPGAGFSRAGLEHAAISNPEASPIAHVEVREKKGMRMGGFGMLIAQKLVDEVIYNEKGNEVILVKHLD